LVEIYLRDSSTAYETGSRIYFTEETMDKFIREEENLLAGQQS
jgi:hypothetical protein